MLVHHHLVVRAKVALPLIKESAATDWLSELISNIGMQTLFGPEAMYCDVEGNEGITAFAILSTSHIALHVWDRDGLMQLDVYSCADFDVKNVVDMLAEFEPLHIDYKFLDRTGDFIEVQ